MTDKPTIPDAESLLFDGVGLATAVVLASGLLVAAAERRARSNTTIALPVVMVACCVGLTLASCVSTRIPGYLQDRPDNLYVREHGRVVPAPREDLAVARGYAGFAARGQLKDGERITIMSAKSTYHVGESVRIIHVLEATSPGRTLYVMGPKPVGDESLDDTLALRAPPPQTYDGLVLRSPGVDFNYDVTTYTFDRPGRHTIEWRGATMADVAGLVSNRLRITVVP